MFDWTENISILMSEKKYYIERSLLFPVGTVFYLICYCFETVKMAWSNFKTCSNYFRVYSFVGQFHTCLKYTQSLWQKSKTLSRSITIK